ncbi:hypothetical protein BCR33DRAFT_714995 [Rhizoclosmatium globosum]|uniref:Uncharacterized protein n=1 Tax=Rhizoclosmatium globosum TaxID=329046 RepID=A0A1Y2CJN3_9FUNG|nr:hypothetical protein BCR33DRAFT_714995 [Rhizoclosmatium globosum]|eukprot:ORY47233.1 hypothetical protein BCR33DRAFT_714995 [Rhizoclosmatium globosum]
MACISANRTPSHFDPSDENPSSRNTSKTLAILPSSFVSLFIPRELSIDATSSSPSREPILRFLALPNPSTSSSSRRSPNPSIRSRAFPKHTSTHPPSPAIHRCPSYGPNKFNRTHALTSPLT